MRYFRIPLNKSKGKSEFHQKQFAEASSRARKEKIFEEAIRTIKEKVTLLSFPAKIAFLKDVSETYKYDCPIPYKNRRKFFDEYKGQWFKDWKFCYVCEDSTIQHIHHIVMLSKGGTNDEANLIGLCEGCHMEIHPWMKNQIVTQQLA